MSWFIFAVLTALFESLKDVFSKRSLGEVDEYIAAWSLRVFALPFLLPALLFIEMPQLGDGFWLALAVSGTLNIAATIFYMKALKFSDLSLAVPMITFTPVFLLVTSPLIVHEFPPTLGLLGILLIVAGSYFLNIAERRKGNLAPFKALIRQKGPRLMLAVAFIWSITANFDKVGVQNSSPIFWVIAVNLFLAIAMFPIMLLRSTQSLQTVSKNVQALVPIGLVSALGLTFQMTAINLALVAYVISIKRTSSIISVLLGYFLFKEKNLKQRLVGATIMVLGVILIALS
ncbi:hypothetical protein A3G16_03375 [Candidatus Curtissbacteria bacterium RIFCSPLOWO2_12_FULL_41_16]|uniref:EamA domain-containing protein n=1 Tax=Candidatus Curtissbacteria bacterium RIFCSPLOWO2_01_FULL_42_50 TaxID=1797730 RepID=A0A1F5H5X2_9BACT|nr:MAG: hypothetical protein A3E71_05120 [Candidatus Curtissbacteria bacterium RIFCSPHIGHO2_12_FULL_42_33]OGD99563.1 MAG: hypothetical protein A3B54_02325 [Candidatus Curtissbacteria bacterium RIFCSPLOWO2_01_FULL_42_50]OGE02543.1 MAG: hypothetical protein A3G16_03375 [Candidatus Curtissbacteria bacterium RIFCSPLOWO2_12_FULL_41_16]